MAEGGEMEIRGAIYLSPELLANKFTAHTVENGDKDD